MAMARRGRNEASLSGESLLKKRAEMHSLLHSLLEIVQQTYLTCSADSSKHSMKYATEMCSF